MKKDKIIRKKIKSRKAKKYRKKKQRKKKRKQGKGKNGKKMTWTWTSRVNPPVSGRKTHPVARALRRDSKGLQGPGKIGAGAFPPLFPPFFPLFPPSMAKIFPQPSALRDDTDRPNETWMKPMKRMKHERKANETNETWMKRVASMITAGVSAAGTGRSSRCPVTAMDVLIFTVDSRLLFPLHLYFAKMPEAGPSDQEWRQNLSSFARPGRDSFPQGQSARPVSK